MAVDQDFEKEHLKNLRTYQQQVEAEYLQAIQDIFQTVAIFNFSKEVFRLDKYPVLKNRIDEILKGFRDRVYNTITAGINNEYKLSGSKAAKTLESAYGDINPIVKERFSQNDLEKAKEFIERKTRRLTLSDRVWKLHNQFYSEIEQTLYSGIGEGKSARTMASQMKQYLREPDKLFRRVRDAKGRLVLSESARKYRPGRGVYRSSFKNALRLTAHETNAAYRGADNNRWQNTHFILGQKIQLSKNHPTNVEPIRCDLLQGTYGVDFKFTGWHIRCLCFSTPLLPSKEEYSAYEDAILAGTDKDFKFSGVVKGFPEHAKQYVVSNQERFEGWKSRPLFHQENPRLINKILEESN